MKTIMMLLMSLSVTAELYMVNSPDIPQEGWYWNPDGPGWGLNMAIQPSTQGEFGYFVQGSAYTYKEDGTPIWYSFSGSYVPNEDVYAWRENRGSMGSLTSPIYETIGGNCLSCPHQQASLVDNDLGEISFEWSDPLNMTMTVGGVTKNLKHFFFHKGLNNNNIEFITEKVWYVHGAASPARFEEIGFSFIRGVAKFTVLTDEIRQSILDSFGGSDRFTFDDSLDWYVMADNVLSSAASAHHGLNIFKEKPLSFTNSRFLLIGYDAQSGLSYLYLGSYSGFSDEYQIDTCLQNEGRNLGLVGVFRPAVGQTTRFYFNREDYMSQCETTDLDDDWFRQQFVDLTMLPTGADDLANVPFMFEESDI